MASEGVAAWRFRAANFFFLIVVFGLPLFNVPCSKGTCSSPVEVIAAYLYSKKLVSNEIVKALLYPSAFLSKAEVVVAQSEAFSLPSWNNLLHEMSFKDNQGSSMGLGFEIGCALCLVGAVASSLGPSILGTSGMLVLLWYIYTGGNADSSIHLLPMFTVAIFCSFAAVNFDGLFTKAKEKSTPDEPTESAEKKKA